MTRRWATAGVFFVNGAAIGTWVAQIPWIQERFDLSKSAIGFVLLGMSLAVVLALPLAGQAVVRHGSARMTWAGGIATALAVNLAVLAPHPALVAVGLFVLGGASATMDVSMRTATALESSATSAGRSCPRCTPAGRLAERPAHRSVRSWPRSAPTRG